MKKILGNPLFFSLLIITFYTLLAHAPLIPFLGFYSDDISFDYIGHFLGPVGLINSQMIDRPAVGYLLALTYYLFGDKVIHWHIAMLIVRLIGGYLLFFVLRKIWPKKITIITSITLLFLIYPGFLQQPIALGYLIWFITLTLSIVSILFTIYTIESSRKSYSFLLTLISLIFQTTTFFLLEFFIGIEILRALLIMSSFKINTKLIKKTVAYWSPYLITTFLFVFWRVFVFKSTRDVTDISWVVQNYYSGAGWLIRIPLEIIYSFLHTVIAAFFLPLAVNFIRIPFDKTVISLLVGLLSIPVTLSCFSKLEILTKQKNKDRSVFGKKLILIGVISVLGALLPIIASGRMVREYLVYDRYTITSMVGVGFIITGFLLWQFSGYKRMWLFSIFLSFCITSQLMNGFYRVANWNVQRNIWWQLYWRSPKIKSNAFLIFDFPKFTKNSLQNKIINSIKWHQIYWVDYQIWATGNLFFNYNDPPSEHFSGDFLSNPDVIQKIKNRVLESFVDRNVEYQKDYANSVIISTANDTSCLWVYDKDREELSQNQNQVVESLISYSNINNLGQIDDQESYPPAMFGKEPIKSWCYFFEKASLARQLKDWGLLSLLTEEVVEKKYQPQDVNEWLPFIEGMVVLKKYSEANNLIKDIISQEKQSDVFTSNICKMVKRLRTKAINIQCK